MSTSPTYAPPGGPTRSPHTGRIVLGVLLVLIGLGWLLDTLGAFDVRWSMVLPAALVVIGVALLATAHRGGSGGLVAAGIALSVLVLLSSLLTLPLTGRLAGIGDVAERPTAAEEAAEGYGLAIGSLTVDLREVALPDEPTTVEAGVGIGELVVHVPAEATLEVDARVGAGEIVVDDVSRSGVGVNVQERLEGDAGAPVIRLEVSVGLGQVEVER